MIVEAAPRDKRRGWALKRHAVGAHSQDPFRKQPSTVTKEILLYMWQNGVSLSPECLPAALFVTAAVAGRKDLNHCTRSLIVSRVRPFDITCPSEALDGLADAFGFAGIGESFRRPSRAGMLRGAASQAQQWLVQGVQVVATDSIPAPGAGMHGLPAVLFARGDTTMLNNPIAGILNSRKPLKMTPQDAWISTTQHLIRHARDNHFTIASSYGPVSYCLASMLAKGSPVIASCDGVLPFMESQDRLDRFLTRFGDLFDLEQTLFLSPFSPGSLPPRASRFGLRDRVVSAVSSVVLAAEVRPGGNMEKILETAAERGIRIWGVAGSGKGKPTVADVAPAEIIGRRVQRKATRARPWSAIEKSSPVAESRLGESTTVGLTHPIPILTPSDSDGGKTPWPTLLPEYPANGKSRFLIHYTRSCPGPWPGQTTGQYCRSLIEACHDAGHTAFDTLSRILEEHLVRGSTKMIRGSTPAVSFTERLPHELKHIVRWHRGLIRWSFEPYAIAVLKDALLTLGVKEVIYGEEHVFRELPKAEKFRFQLVKPDGNDWAREKEWRLSGDLDLRLVPREHFVAIVPTTEEAALLQRRFDCRIAGLQAWGSNNLP